MYDKMRGKYITALNKAAESVLARNKPANKRSDKEKKILQEAVQEDVPVIRENESLGRVYNHTRAAIDAIENQTKKSIEGTAEAVEAGVELRDSERVAREKMGRGENRNKRPGLMGHFDRITEAIADGKPEVIQERFNALNNFLNSQKQKLTRLTNFMNLSEEEQAKHKEFRYKENVTEKYYDTLFDEFETMKQVHAELTGLYNEWAGEKGKANIPAAPATPKKRQWKKAKPESTKEQPAKAEAKPAKGRKRNWKGKSNEERTEQGSTEDDVGKPSSNDGSGTKKAPKPKASAKSKPVGKGAEGTPKNTPAKSQERKGRAAKQTPKDVAYTRAQLEEMPPRQVWNIARDLGKPILKSVSVKEMIDFILWHGSRNNQPTADNAIAERQKKESKAAEKAAPAGSVQRNINRLEAEIAAVDKRMKLPSAALKKQADERGLKLTEYRRLMRDNQIKRRAELARLREQLKTAPKENTENIKFTEEPIDVEIEEDTSLRTFIHCCRRVHLCWRALGYCSPLRL
jgi:hypothetical protein